MPFIRTDLGLTFAAALAATTLFAPGAYAQSDPGATVTTVDAVGRAPTSVSIRLAGKSPKAVSTEIRGAAQTVCRNAVLNREMWALDYAGCREATHETALADYRSIVRRQGRTAPSNALAGGVVLNIAAR